MKILITGIYGFLGSHLAKKLSEKHTVIGLYHTSKADYADRAILCYNELDLVDVIPDAIVMCHAAVSSGTANMDKEVLFETNVAFTRQVIGKFPTVKTIYISSVSVFGNTKEVIQEQTLTNPETDYAMSKLAGEKEVRQNPNAVSIRFSSLYGNKMKENTLIPNYCNQAIQSKTIEVWGNGSRFQNYIHVDDAVSLIEKVLEGKSKIDFPILGVASKEYSNDQVAKIISDLTHSSIHYCHQDSAISFHYNNELTQKVVNWHSKTELKDGLKKYLEWKEKQS
jgi:UDP-glucose 4-epimerase